MRNREQVKEELAAYFEDSVYWCGRVPEAWSYGTMTIEDFSPAWDDEDILESILEICEGTLADHVEAIKKYLKENELPDMTKRAFIADLHDVLREVGDESHLRQSPGH